MASPEELAREKIDKLLSDCGWIIQNRSSINLSAARGIAIREALLKIKEGLETVFYNAQNNFTLQYTVLLAPLRPEDSEKEILRKIRVVAAYLDILIARRIWNFRAIDYSTMQYAMFLIMRDIRGKTATEVADILGTR